MDYTQLSQQLCTPLSEYNGAGVPVGLSEVYDLIKEERKEDAAQLSQGIWKTKPKQANFDKVIELCAHVLTTQSKDLQVAGWLCEALLVKHGLQGGVYGAELLTSLCDALWPVVYPNALSLYLEQQDQLSYDTFETLSFANPQDLTAQDEQQLNEEIALKRNLILQWLDNTLAQRLLTIEIVPATQDAMWPPITLAKWIDATDFNQKQMRGYYADEANINETDGFEKRLSLEMCKKALQSLKASFVKDQLKRIEHFIEALGVLSRILLASDLPHAIEFPATRKKLEQLLQIYKTVRGIEEVAPTQSKPFQADMPRSVPHMNDHSDRQTNTAADMGKSDKQNQDDKPSTLSGLATPQQAPTANQQAIDANRAQMTVFEREDAYVALEQISQFLTQVDPHSPSPQLLGLILGWKNKTIVQIMQDIKQGESEAHMMLRMLTDKASSIA